MRIKILFSFLLLVFVSNNSISQLIFGVYGGINFGNGKYNVLRTTNTIDIEGKTKSSFSFGGFLETKLFSVFYLQSGVNFTDHRILLNDMSVFYDGSIIVGGSSPIELSIRYTEVPLILKIKKEFDKYIPFFYSGIGVGFLYKAEDLEGKMKYPYSYSSITKDQYSFLLLGFGLEYAMSRDTNLFFMMRYSNSFVDVAASDRVYFKPNNYDFLLGVSTKLLDF